MEDETINIPEDYDEVYQEEQYREFQEANWYEYFHIY